MEMSVHLVEEIRQGDIDLQAPRPHLLAVGRPSKPALVSPAKLPRRGFSTQTQRLAMAHAIAHIEFNAINLAWDAVWRFTGMPDQYYMDWARVAGDETRHFNLLRKYMRERGSDYGAFDAHDGLWIMAERTSGDVLHRMAIVPRVLEARGLDVTPAMIGKFQDHGDTEMVEILTTIYEEEIEHVRIGNEWYSSLCRDRGLEPISTFIDLLEKYEVVERSSGLNQPARIQAGFSFTELEAIKSFSGDNLNK